MRRFSRACLTALAAAAIAGCAPTVTIKNETEEPVRVVLSGANGRQVLSTSPGGTTAGEVAVGQWSLTVIPEEEWREIALDLREQLVERLENPNNLTGSEIEELIEQIQDVSEQLEQLEDASRDGGAFCNNVVAEDEMTASAVIGEDEDGELEVVCTAGESIRDQIDKQQK